MSMSTVQYVDVCVCVNLNCCCAVSVSANGGLAHDMQEQAVCEGEKLRLWMVVGVIQWY